MTRQELAKRIGGLLREQSTQTVLYHSFIAEQMGLNTTDHKVLDVLVKSDEMTAGQIAEVTRLTSGAITGVIDRLEKAGFVNRVYDKKDRRKVFIRVVPETEKKLLPIFAPMMKRTQEILDKYTDAELATVADFIESCIDAMKSAGKSQE